ncbi:hypothetical protein HYS49_03910 [Candidatus Woesearchaeota archaeon]|nr:hypothetical protein [Candidatus Woesearchaeota archaeon]
MQCVNHADYLRIGDRKTIPHLSEAQEGFIPTSNLWIDAADSDGVGGLETIFFVDELSSCSPRDSPTARLYGIIWDANGEPDLVPYRVGTEE